LQDHLKERLTGAAILVIVVVLLVPELFRGPPGALPKPGASAAAGPPVRSYTIDLRDTAATQPPGASAAPPANSPATAPGAPPQALPNSPAAAAPAPPAAASSAAPATPPGTAAPLSAAAPAAPKPATAAPGAHAGTTKGGWTVQVGSFARRDYAERMVKQVSAKGFAVEVAGPDDHGLYRVRSAPQAERAAAMALKQKMQASGLKPIVNTAP
jgi:cell division septation protein DedD